MLIQIFLAFSLICALLIVFLILSRKNIKGFAKYFGLPISRLSTKHYFKIMQIPDEKKNFVFETKNRNIDYKKKQNH